MVSPRAKERLKTVGLVTLGAGVLAGLAALVVDFMDSGGTPKRHVVTTITAVKLPPPPPPPPPKEEPPPRVEEPKIKEPDPIKPEAKKPEPAPAPPPPGLGFEGEGGPGGYGDIGVAGSGTGVGGGSGSGGGGSLEGWYAGLLVADLQQSLQKHEKTRKGSFRAVVKLWIGADGAVTRAQLVSSSGDKEQDAGILEVVNGHVFSEPLPSGVRLPIQVRLSGRRPT